MTVPFAFANLSGNIALAKLDSNFNTPITIGNTSVLLGNTITTINNVTLANVTISSGTASNISLTSPLAVSSGGTGSANLTVNNVLIGNGTSAVTSVAPGTTGNVLTSIGGAWVSNAVVTNAAAGANTQIQYNSANLLAGSANFVFDGTNVGIGTASPSEMLTVAGGIGSRQNTNGASNILVINSNTGSSANARFRLASDVVIGNLQANSSTNTPQLALTVEGAYPLTFLTTNTERMRLDASGNLNIGTTGQTDKLYVYANTSSSGLFVRNDGAGPIQTWATFGTTQMLLNASGNLGIGTSSPSAKLDVNGAITMSATATTKLSWNNSGAYSNWIECGGVAGNNYMRFATGNAEAMRLDSSGNLGLGTTSPSASAILDAQSTTKGVRMPNMTTTQKNAISSPAAGLMVFDTTLAKLCVYSGSAWQTITSV